MAKCVAVIYGQVISSLAMGSQDWGEAGNWCGSLLARSGRTDLGRVCRFRRDFG
jgi:hypothetical protein